MSGNSRRYVIVTPFKKVDVLAGICKIHGLDVWVVPSKQGAMVVHDLPVPVFDDWDISELLGGGESADDIVPVSDDESLFDSRDGAQTQTEPATPDSTADGADEQAGSKEPPATETLSADDSEGVAKALARLSRAGVVLLTCELGEDVGLEEGVSGLVTALVYDSEGRASDTPAGLIVATGEAILEDLLLGSQEPETVRGAIRSGQIDTTAIERLAEGRAKSDTPLPPRRPRRLFGRDT